MAKKSHNTKIKKTLQTFAIHFFTALQIVAVAGLWLCDISIYLSPAKHSWVSVLTMGFPFFVGFVVAAGVLSLIMVPRRAYISLVGLLLCFSTIRDYMPINLKKDAPEGAWHVMTWNLGGYSWSDSTRTQLETYLRDANLDILCMQEIPESRMNGLQEKLRDRLPYSRAVYYDGGGTGRAIMSRWPVVDCDTVLAFGSNGVVCFKLLVAPSDTLYVVNCHLQSMHLPEEVSSSYQAIVKHEQTNSDSVANTSRTLISRIRENGAIRAEQADSVAAYLQKYAHSKVLVMGDFNDTPVSYSRQRIAGAMPLTDCWRATGNGVARTYNRYAIYVRIDHIFCAEKFFTPYQCRIDRTILSDHYPVDVHLLPITENNN